MIIELYGIPGAGKSSFAREIKRSCASVISLNSKRESLYWGTRFILAHPLISFWQLFYFLKFFEARSLYHRLVSVFVSRNAKYRKAEKSEGRVVIDEGLLQNMLSLPTRVLRGNEAYNMVRRLNCSDYLIVFSANTSVLLERYARRGALPRGFYGEAYAKEWVDILRNNHAQILEVIKSENIPYTLVENSRTKEALKNICEL